MPMTDSLFQLQALDTSIDRLRHDRISLPQHLEIAQIDAKIATAEEAAKPALAQQTELRSDEDALDERAREFSHKAKEVETKMYSGDITSPKELQAMQTEVEHLRAAASGVEDEELALMEREAVITAEIEAALAPIPALVTQRGAGSQRCCRRSTH